MLPPLNHFHHNHLDRLHLSSCKSAGATNFVSRFENVIFPFLFLNVRWLKIILCCSCPVTTSVRVYVWSITIRLKFLSLDLIYILLYYYDIILLGGDARRLAVCISSIVLCVHLIHWTKFISQLIIKKLKRYIVPLIV